MKVYFMNVENFSAVVSRELAMARESRLAGQEGKARVCARRAAGFALKELLEQENDQQVSRNLYSLLQQAPLVLDLPQHAVRSVQHLTMRVDTDNQLPEGVDLILEAESLIQIFSQIADGISKSSSAMGEGSSPESV
jgi:hypothetical protein